MKEAQNLLKYELLSEKISRMKHFALIFKAKKQKKKQIVCIIWNSQWEAKSGFIMGAAKNTPFKYSTKLFLSLVTPKTMKKRVISWALQKNTPFQISLTIYPDTIYETQKKRGKSCYIMGAAKKHPFQISWAVHP